MSEQAMLAIAQWLRQPARTQRTSKEEEHKPNHRTGTSSGTSYRSLRLHYRERERERPSDRYR